MNIERTRERLKIATQLAKQEFGSEEPAVVAGLIQSLATDELMDRMEKVVDELTDKISQAAAVAAGY